MCTLKFRLVYTIHLTASLTLLSWALATTSLSSGVLEEDLDRSEVRDLLNCNFIIIDKF